MRLIPKILFIDDDKFFLEFYRAEFAQYNFQTDFAKDGEEGLKRAREIKPDVILLDILLPQKDGFEVLRELKLDKETKDIPVIIISALGAESDIEKLMNLGAVRMFNKLIHLPKDVVVYIQEGLKIGFNKKEIVVKDTGIELSAEETNKIFIESTKEVENLLIKLFNKKISLEDINVALISFKKFKSQIKEISRQAGSIFIYSKIGTKVPGLAFLSIKRNDTLNLIKLIEKGTIGREMGFGMNDKVVEEFFNITVNAFLTKMATSIQGRYLLQPPVITNPRLIIEMIDKVKIPENNLVAMLEEVFMIEELDLGFSIFIIFAKEIFKKN